MSHSANTSLGIRLKSPSHPGDFIKTEILDPLGLSVTHAAKVLGVTRAALSALLNTRANLSPEMALRLEKAMNVFLRISMDTLLRMQNSYDIARMRAREADVHVAPFDPIMPSLHP
jgi:antitoxin HigA-1